MFRILKETISVKRFSWYMQKKQVVLIFASNVLMTYGLLGKYLCRKWIKSQKGL